MPRLCLACRAKIEGLSRCENCTSLVRGNFASTKVLYQIQKMSSCLTFTKKEWTSNSTHVTTTYIIWLKTALSAALLWIFKRKVKGRRITDHDGLEGEQKYSSTVSLTSALDMGGWSTTSPGRFNPGKTRYPLYRRLGGLQCRSGRVRKDSPSTGIRSRDRPARNESLYRLSYPGPDLGTITVSFSRSPWFGSRTQGGLFCTIFYVKFLSPSNKFL